ncbi:MAG: DUF5615 family PIN-like protein [Planctomycetota bacterium]
MKVLVDVNLSPAWVAFLGEAGIDAQHWGAVGDMRAPDHEVMEWAMKNDHVVFTHDLDFSALLASSGNPGPSVIQFRTHDVMPEALGPLVVSLLRQHEAALEKGSILSVDLLGGRIRALPIRKGPER